MKFLIGIALALFALTAQAQSRTGLVFSTVSKHFGGDGVPCNYSETGKETLREHNPGVGLRVELDRKIALEAGYYKNSAWKDTFYTLSKWTPLDYGVARFGLAGGIATGYCKPIFPIVGLTTSVDITKNLGFDLIAAPPYKQTDGVVGLQLKLMF